MSSLTVSGRLTAMRQKLRQWWDPGQFLILGLLALGAVFMIMPLVYMASTSLKPLDELFVFPPRFLVRNPTLDNFRDLLTATTALWVPLSRNIFNSIVVTGLGVVGTVLLSCMAGYPLAKHNFPGRKLVLWLVTSSLLFAPQVVQIPRYLVVEKLGLMDTYSALILPALINSVGVFMMSNFFTQIPDALLEAARVDGASELTIFLKVVMPISKPAWGTLAILSFVGMWNEGYSGTVFLRTEAMKPLPTILSTLTAQNVVSGQGANNAAAVLTVIPTILIFILLQRRVMETMVHTGIKS